MIIVNGIRIYDRFDDDHPETPEICDPMSLAEFGVIERQIDLSDPNLDRLIEVIYRFEELFEETHWVIVWGHCRYKRRICQYTLHFSKDGGETSATTSFLLPLGDTDDSVAVQYFLSLNPAIKDGMCVFTDNNAEEALKAVSALQRILSRRV